MRLLVLLLSLFLMSFSAWAQEEDEMPSFSPPLVGGDAFSYDPTSQRDPFKPFFTEVPTGPVGSGTTGTAVVDPAKMGLRGYDLESLQLVGVLWGTNDPKGLVKAPSGKVYVVRKKTKIGTRGGFVAVIREGEVVVVEPTGEGHKAVSRSLILGKAAVQ